MKKLVGLILLVALMIGAAQAGDLPMFGHDAMHTCAVGQAYNLFRDKNCCIEG